MTWRTTFGILRVIVVVYQVLFNQEVKLNKSFKKGCKYQTIPRQ